MGTPSPITWLMTCEEVDSCCWLAVMATGSFFLLTLRLGSLLRVFSGIEPCLLSGENLPDGFCGTVLGIARCFFGSFWLLRMLETFSSSLLGVE